MHFRLRCWLCLRRRSASWWTAPADARIELEAMTRTPTQDGAPPGLALVPLVLVEAFEDYYTEELEAEQVFLEDLVAVRSE